MLFQIAYAIEMLCEMEPETLLIVRNTALVSRGVLKSHRSLICYAFEMLCEMEPETVLIVRNKALVSRGAPKSHRSLICHKSHT
jgi:hypothetical protein